MKTASLLIILLSLFSVGASKGQDAAVELFSVPLSRPGQPGKLIVNQISGSINLIGYEGKEVILKASFERQGQKNEMTSQNGLKRITNTSLDLEIEQKDNIVQLTNEQYNRRTDLEIKVPVNFDLMLKTITNGDIHVRNVNGKMEVSNGEGHINMQDVSGTVLADTQGGNIEIVFNSNMKNESAAMVFSSFSGNIHVTFPASIKANVKAQSDQGDIFTNFDIKIEEQRPQVNIVNSADQYKVNIEQWINGKINGGGAQVLFRTFDGDITIKAK